MKIKQILPVASILMLLVLNASPIQARKPEKAGKADQPVRVKLWTCLEYAVPEPDDAIDTFAAPPTNKPSPLRASLWDDPLAVWLPDTGFTGGYYLARFWLFYDLDVAGGDTFITSVQFAGKGYDGIWHETAWIDLDPRVRVDENGFEIEVFEQLEVWRHKRKNGGPPDRPVGTVSLGYVRFTLGDCGQ